MDNTKHRLLITPLFHTELVLPKYEALKKNNWQITYMKMGFDHGYFTDVWTVENMPILTRRSKEDNEQWETWMSISPHELESQELCCEYAYGKVVIMGLGMGWVAINTAFNSKVEKVIVIEIDEEVIEIFGESKALSDVPQDIQNKIVIVKADALNWKPESEKIDFLYIDIWKNLVEPQTIEDVHRIQNNICAQLIYFWGQELFFFKEYFESGLSEQNMNKQFLLKIMKKMNLPLLLPEDVDYASMVIKAGKQRIKRRLPLSR